MTITNGYTTLALMRLRLGICDATYTTEDPAIESAVMAASRQIDAYCGRRFWKNTVDETRYYTPTAADSLEVDDLVTVTTLKTDEDGDATFENTWTVTTDYILHPRNAALEVMPGSYTRITTAYNGSYWFPVGVPDSVQIVGVFGYSAVPTEIAEACMLQTSHIFRRKDSPDGIAGVNEFGVVRVTGGLDADARMLCEAYRKIVWAT